MTAATADAANVPGIITQLNEEWERRHARRELNFGSLGTMRGRDLFVKLTNPESKAANDALLYDVIVLAQKRDTVGETAGRALIQAMIPTVLHLTARSRALVHVGWGERYGTVISCLWQAVQAYPTHQQHSVSSTLTLNTLSLVNTTESHRRARSPYQEITVEDTDLTGYADRPVDALERTGTGDDSFDDLVRVLTWAVDTKVLTRDEVSTLARFDLGDEEDHAALQADRDWNYEAMKKAVWRIRRKLINAVQQMVLDRDDF